MIEGEGYTDIQKENVDILGSIKRKDDLENLTHTGQINFKRSKGK